MQILSSYFYSVEERARSLIKKKLQSLELTSDSEDSGLEHYMEREEFNQLATHNYDIGVFYNKKFSRKLSKKILVKLWEISYFIEDENLRGMILSFVQENEKKFHIQNDPAISAEFASIVYFKLFFESKLRNQPQYLNNLIGNKYTLRDNTEHLTLFEIIKNLKLHYGIKMIAKAKKPQRHKGYRDHGSLSDETSRVIRREFLNDDQSFDLQLKKEIREKKEQDALEILKGFLQ